MGDRIMLAGAVSNVARKASDAVNAAQEAVNAASSRVRDFASDLAASAANANQPQQQPANNNGVQSLPNGVAPPNGVPPVSQPSQDNGISQPAQGNGSDPTASQTGLGRETLRAGNTIADPAAEIGRLNSDGDQVVMTMTGEGKLQVPTVRLPIAIGAKAQYGYGITVQQVGDNPAPGTNGQAPTYNVTFDKNLLAGGIVEPEVPGIDPAAELNLRTTGSVTMNFDSQADAARAVGILQRLAASETLRDAGSLATPGISNPASNPVVDDGSSGLPSLPNPADPLADRIAPSQADMTFLRDNVTTYTSQIGLQERGKVAAKFANLGIEPRLDANQTITRTVELPRDGQPGRLTYTLSGDLQASTKEKLTIGKQQIDQLEIGYVPQNIVDHGQLRGEVSISWDLPPGATDTTISGQPVPELSSLNGGEGLGAPDRVSARLQLDHQTQSLGDLSRTDMRRISIEATTNNPGQHAGPVLNSLLQGDLEGAFRGMGDDFTVTAQNETIRRDGVHQQHEVGVELKDTFEAKLSLIGNVGLDDITARQTATFTGTQIADRLGGPRQPAPVEPPPTPPETRPDQLVVVPNDGLNVRPTPSTDGARTGVFQHGTFVQPTGARQTDAQGNQWVEVRGPDVNDRPVQGWVAAEHVRPHPAGAMDDAGRINPNLEAQGYRAHVVQPGDTVWDIARRDGVNFRDTMQLNGDHLINPGLIFPGDKVYIPGTGRAQPPAPPAEPPQQPAPQQPSSPSAPSESSPSAPSDAPSQGSPSTPSDRPSGAPSNGSPSDGAPSNGAPSDDGAPSLGAPSDGAPTEGTPTPPTQQPAQPGAPVNGRPDLNRVLREYQMPDDPGGMVKWEPHGGILGTAAGWFTDPVNVTATEARMLDQMSIWDQKAMSDIKDDAFATADRRYPHPQDQRGQFPPGQTGDDQFTRWATNDGHNDAFRHAYWNALMTKRFGADFTERFTLAHEGAAGNKADREAMDLYNNEVGRRIAQANPNASERELADLVQQAIGRGEMVVIDRAGNLAWSDQVRYGQHGVANDSPVPGVLAPPQPNGPNSSGPGTS
jgi:LysM repeat protein